MIITTELRETKNHSVSIDISLVRTRQHKDIAGTLFQYNDMEIAT